MNNPKQLNEFAHAAVEAGLDAEAALNDLRAAVDEEGSQGDELLVIDVRLSILSQDAHQLVQRADRIASSIRQLGNAS